MQNPGFWRSAMRGLDRPCGPCQTGGLIGRTAMVKTVEELLVEARALLPHRFTPEETLHEIDLGTLVIDIRGDEQQRQDGLIPGAIIIRRNVLEWRCDPASFWHHSEIKHHGQRVILVCDQGYQSSLAAANLQQLGLKQATDMADGFSGWRNSGLPIAPYGTSSWLALRGKIRRWFLLLFRRFD